MADYGVFAATHSRRVPPAYILRPSADAFHNAVAHKLKEHGIRVEVLSDSARVAVEEFTIDLVRRAQRLFQGHRETAVTGRLARRTVNLPAGSIVVRTDQPLGRLVFYLLEPESDDSLTTWNLLDSAVAAGAPHPALKVMPGQRLQTRTWP